MKWLAWFLVFTLATGLFVGTVGFTAWAKTVELTVLWRENPLEIDTMKKAFEAFTAKHPDIKVKLISAPPGDEHEAKLKVMFAAGIPPDVFASLSSSGICDFVYNDMVLDLTPYIERDGYDLSDFLPGAVEKFTFAGRIYGIPRGGMPIIGIYNVELFEQTGLPSPPTSWEDPKWTWATALAYARKLTKDLNGDGTPDQWGLISFEDLFNRAPLLWGTTVFPREVYKYGIGTKSNLDSPEVVEAIETLVDLELKHKVVGPGFAAGKVGMYFQLHNLRAIDEQDQYRFEWSIMPIPRGRPNVQQMSTTYTGPLCIAKTTKHPNEAWELVKFLCSPEGQKFIAPGALIGTSRKSLYPWFWGGIKNKNLNLRLIQDVIIGGYRFGFETANVRLVNSQRIFQAFKQVEAEIRSGKKGVAPALKEAKPVIEAIMKEIYNANKERAKVLFPGESF